MQLFSHYIFENGEKFWLKLGYRKRDKMKKTILIILGLLSLISCISSIDYIYGATKVENRVKVYIDNLSSQDVVATVRINYINPVTFGGITTIIRNTTESSIEVDFTKDTKAQNGEGYSMYLLITTSDSAIHEYNVSDYNKRSDGIYMEYPRPKMIIKDSQSTESAFEVTRESY